MPLTSGNTDVEQLMRDAGVSVNMSYGCESGAYGSAIPNSFLSTFLMHRRIGGATLPLSDTQE
ncbi:MAG: hypothetical protein ABI148_05920 [Ginsengibacter sp.]